MLSRSPWKAALLSTNQIPRVIPPGDQQDPKSGETALTPGQEKKPHPCSLWPQRAPSSLTVSPAPVATTPQPLPSLPRSQNLSFIFWAIQPVRIFFGARFGDSSKRRLPRVCRRSWKPWDAQATGKPEPHPASVSDPTELSREALVIWPPAGPQHFWVALCGARRWTC